MRVKPLGVYLLVFPGHCIQLWDLSLKTWKEALWEFIFYRQTPVTLFLQYQSIASVEDSIPPLTPLPRSPPSVAAPDQNDCRGSKPHSHQTRNHKVRGCFAKEMGGSCGLLLPTSPLGPETGPAESPVQREAWQRALPPLPPCEHSRQSIWAGRSPG